MKIGSSKKVRKKGSRIRGIASAILDNNDIVNDIRIIEGDNSLFIAFPTPKPFSGKEYDEMNEEERQEQSIYREKLKGMDKLVIEKFNKLKD